MNKKRHRHTASGKTLHYKLIWFGLNVLQFFNVRYLDVQQINAWWWSRWSANRSCVTRAACVVVSENSTEINRYKYIYVCVCVYLCARVLLIRLKSTQALRLVLPFLLGVLEFYCYYHVSSLSKNICIKEKSFNIYKRSNKKMVLFIMW